MRVLISSRNTLIPNGLQQTLSLSRHHIQAHYYQSTEQLVAKSILEQTEVVMLDKSGPEVFSFDEVRELQRRLPRLKIILLSTIEYLDFIHQCYNNGVEGYLTYDCSADELEEAFGEIERGGQYFCQRILSQLMPRLSSAAVTPGKALTERETEIAELIAQGHTNKQIGEQLCISPHTVHTHRKSLMKKLNVSSAREVTLYILSLH